MLQNYLTIALRNLVRHPGYALINVLGLAVGVACCILVGLFASHEFGTDRFHPFSDRTYRLIRQTQMQDGEVQFSNSVMGPLAPAIVESIPEVENAIRLWKRWNWVRLGERMLNRRFFVVEEGFLRMFPPRLIAGTLESLSRIPKSVIISQETAQMFFGDADPIGKVISCDYKYVTGDYTVVGVVADAPENTDYGYHVLTMSVHTGYWMHHVWTEWRPQSTWRPLDIFILLREGADPDAVENKLAGMIERRYGSDYAERYAYHLQPLHRIHLYSDQDYGMRSSGDIGRVYTLVIGGLFVLLVACINYVNLATARSTTRAREVGLRKVVGALRGQLTGQFLGESCILSTLATAVGLLLAVLAQPAFNAYTQRDLVLDSAGIFALIPALVLIALVVGAGAGAYPALVLSGSQAASVIKGATPAGRKRLTLRKALVVIQFAISTGLVTGTLIVGRQLDFMRTKELGFKTDQIISMWILGSVPLHPRWKEVKARFLQHPNISQASATSSYVGVRAEYWQFIPEGYQDKSVQFWTMAVDEDFIDMFGIELVQGSNVAKTMPADSTLSFLLNESAVKALGWANPVGKRFERDVQLSTRMGTVVGVVKDFHGRSLHSKIEPMVLVKYPPSFRHISFKVRSEGVQETIAFMKETWEALWPSEPFSYRFLDDLIERLYREEARTASIFQVLSSIAIFVACLGLVGLSSFTVQQRTREIGIRKVVGASQPGIVDMLAREFLLLVIVAGLVAAPVTYLASLRWLESFAYRTDPGVLVFVVGILLTAVAALGVTSWQAVRAARTNPVDALRYE